MSGVLKKDDNGYPVSGGVSTSDANVVLNSQISPITGRLQVDSAGGGTGTVTSVSVVSANGFAGTVATATTTPAITLTTSINSPVLSGNGTAIAAATTTGSGSTVVLNNGPTLIAPVLGTPASGVATNLTGTAAGLTAGTVTTNANLTGAVTSSGNATSLGSFSSANLATALTDETGTGVSVFGTSPTFTTSLITPKVAAATNTSVNLVGTYSTIQTYTPSAAGTATLDLSLGNIHHITMPAGNITIALSNGTAGQCFIIRILQDGTGSRIVTWFTTIRWAGGSAPTLTTTASKADTLGFEITGSNTYDGFVVGQNI